MNQLAAQLWQCSWQAAVVAAVVCILQLLLRRRLSPSWRCALWSLVLVRLLIPTFPASRFSLFDLPRIMSQSFARRDQPTSAPPTDLFPPAPQSPTTTYGLLPADALEPSQPSRASSAASANSPLTSPVRLALGIAWLLGVIALGARLAWTNIAFSRRAARGRALTHGRQVDLLNSCCAELNLRRAPRLVVTDAVDVPALAGIIRPRILLPPDLATSLPADELRLVLLHELCHLKRHDLALDWACTTLNVIHWFNPILWFAAARFHADRELARDAMVLRAAGPGAARSYGLTMLRLIESSSAGAAAGTARIARPVLAALFESRSSLRERIDMIARFDHHRRSTFSTIFGLCILLIVGCATLTKPRSDSSAVPRSTASATTLPPSAEAPWEAQTRAILARRIPVIDFNNKAFGDAIDFLRDAMGASFFVDWRSIEDAGITKEAPVKIRMRDISAEHALRTILAEASGGAHVREPLDFVVADGVIVITTRDQARRRTPTQTRVYDISDLVVEVPDFDDPPSLSLISSSSAAAATSQAGTRQTKPAEPVQTRAQRAATVEQLVRETVEPDSWKSTGTIKQDRNGALLVIRQTANVHSQVEQLLNQLRETRGLQIEIETRFVALDRWAMDRAGVRPTARPAGPTTNNSSANAVFLSDEAVQSLLHSPDGAQHVHIIASPRLTLFNGQRGYVLVATQRAYVSGFAPSASDRTRFEPVVDVANTGLLNDVQATLSSDRRNVTLTLRPQISRVDRLEDHPWPGSPANNPPLMVQRPILSIKQLRTTLSIPDAQTAVLGGFEETIAPAAATGAGAATRPSTAAGSVIDQMLVPATSDRAVFMLVKPTIILGEKRKR